MIFRDVIVESLACELPPERWSSAKIEEMLGSLYDRLGLPYGRLELMTGIKERRFWPDPVLPSEASALAGAKALNGSDTTKDRLDLVVHTGVCRDRLEPATAAYVHQRLDLPSHAQVFDLSNACLGFLNAMTMAGSMIDNHQIERALIVAGENGRPLIERTVAELVSRDLDRNTIKPYFANLTIGAGAAAAILSHRSCCKELKPRLIGGIVETDTRHHDLCQGDTAGQDGLEMQTNSEELLNAGIEVAKKAWNRFKDELGWTESTPDHIITHQVGRAHQRRLYEELNLDIEKDYSTFESLGNVGSASLPMTLAQAADYGVIQKGEKIALLGIGSGLSCMMLGVEW